MKSCAGRFLRPLSRCLSLGLIFLFSDEAGCAAVRPGTGGTAFAKPNIVLILADDLGYGDVGCYGGTLVPTPAIDSLARTGVRCTSGYVTAPVCAPSRCGLMSGAYNQRFGMQWNEDRVRYAFGAHQLMPLALKRAGYATGHIGKWNVGAEIKDSFDETHDVIDWEADFLPDATGRYVGVDDPKKRDSSKIQGRWGTGAPDEGEYLTDRLGRHAVEFIERHRTHPFFLYLAFNAVHSPWQGKAADRERFAHIKPEPLNFYAAMLASLDENIGRVLEKIAACGLEQDTFVVFVSDNGPARGSPGIKGWPETWSREGFIVGSTGPLRGWKAQFHEGGIREPFLLRWPSRLKAGAVYERPVSTMDLYATFCAAANAVIPEGTRLDGVNLLPYLLGERTGDPHDILFWINGDVGAVRSGDWKLVLLPYKPGRQLFDLASDLGEKNDVAASQPEVTARLQRAWTEWSASLPPRASPPDASGRKSKAPGKSVRE